MARKIIPEAGPFRYIKDNDSHEPFENKLKEINGLDLSSLHKKNDGQMHVFVYESNGKILCFLVFEDKYDHFYLNLIEKNEIYLEECDQLAAPAALMQYMEIISSVYGYKKILNS